jgi:hypothetical protein
MPGAARLEAHLPEETLKERPVEVTIAIDGAFFLQSGLMRGRVEAHAEVADLATNFLAKGTPILTATKGQCSFQWVL